MRLARTCKIFLDMSWPEEDDVYSSIVIRWRFRYYRVRFCRQQTNFKKQIHDVGVLFLDTIIPRLAQVYVSVVLFLDAIIPRHGVLFLDAMLPRHCAAYDFCSVKVILAFLIAGFKCERKLVGPQ